ncbi:hypothetical protein C8R44DRAFT_891191 [Mycena epipterygia]|nr:hypothetical protein C8R44DRAFT_891191 [Mycena epipterygia]
MVVQIAVLQVASANARRWAALAAHGLNRLAAASQHLAGTSGYLWIGGAGTGLAKESVQSIEKGVSR